MCRNQLGSRFAKNLTALFLIFNVTIMIRFFCARYVHAQTQNSQSLTGFTDRLIQVIWLLAMLVSLLAFNLANWDFGFHYFKCASEIEFLGPGGNLSASANKEKFRKSELCHRWTNVGVTSFNIFFCLAYTAIATIIALRKIDNPDHDPTFVLLVAARLCIGLLQVTSFVFLL